MDNKELSTLYIISLKKKNQVNVINRPGLAEAVLYTPLS